MSKDIKEVIALVDKSIILFDEEHEKFPGVIKQFNLTETGEDKPYRMTALISETEAGKGKVLNEWQFAITEDDINLLKSKKQVTLTRLVNIPDKQISIDYRAIIVG